MGIIDLGNDFLGKTFCKQYITQDLNKKSTWKFRLRFMDYNIVSRVTYSASHNQRLF